MHLIPRCNGDTSISMRNACTTKLFFTPGLEPYRARDTQNCQNCILGWVRRRQQQTRRNVTSDGCVADTTEPTLVKLEDTRIKPRGLKAVASEIRHSWRSQECLLGWVRRRHEHPRTHTGKGYPPGGMLNSQGAKGAFGAFASRIS